MDLTTDYLGLRLKNPLVAGASPLSRSVDSVRRLADAGCAAVVVHSLFVEQIEHEADEHEHYQALGTQSFGESLSYLPALDYFPRGPEEYVAHIAALKAAVDIPIIPSLNGTRPGAWTKYARMLVEAGADAIELNAYNLATDPAVSTQDVEGRYVELLQAVKREVSVPVSMKLGPFFSSFANFASRLDEAGADGLVLFNRFYQPDIDLETLEVVPDLALSAPHQIRLPLRWIAVLDPIVKASLAASSGIYTAADVLKLVMVGADATMLCAALLTKGPEVIGRILGDIAAWMEEHEYQSIRQMQGSMNHRACPDPAAFERTHYIKALHTYT